MRYTENFLQIYTKILYFIFSCRVFMIENELTRDTSYIFNSCIEFEFLNPLT